MTFASICLLSLLLGVEPQAQSAPSDTDVRKLVERSLPFLEQGAVEWMETKKCATCHHVPMMLWTHYTAREYGFVVNEKAVLDLDSQSRAHYLGHPEFTPTGQDKGFMEKTLGPGTIYLSLALQSNPALGEDSVKALQQLRENFVKHQNENGSWTTKANQPPLVDDHEVMTMLILLALDNGDPASKYREPRERAVKWLKEVPRREESQVLALRTLVAARVGDKEEISKNVESLRNRQQSDGGWSQKDGLATDALATGQVLYALMSAGVTPNDSAVIRARGFLASTQRPDGSWLIHTRNANGHDPIISYYGSGWATLGLIRTLPKPAAVQP